MPDATRRSTIPPLSPSLDSRHSLIEDIDGPMAFEMVKRLRAFWSRIIR